MAVFTHITEEQLVQHLSQFDIGGLVSFTVIAEGVENNNYKLITKQGPFILTLFEKRTKPEDLPFFTAFMKHLRGKDIPCAAVIPALDGKEITTLGGRPSIITSFLEGTWPRQTDVYHAEAVGTTLARMHLASGSFKMQRENAMSLPAWKKLITACAGKTDLLPFLQKELEYIGQGKDLNRFFEKNGMEELPKGAVHADLFPDNVFFTGKNLTGVIDFYFSCTDFFAYDLMLTLNAWCFNKDGTLNRTRKDAFLTGYQTVRPLMKAETLSLPFFGRAAAMRIIATRLYDLLHSPAGAMVTPKDPQEHVRILEFYQTESLPL